MPFIVPLDKAQAQFPEYTFLRALTPSEQKAAFHVQTADGEDLCFKIIAPNYSIDRLDREIYALQVVDHPNVVRLKEYTFSTKGGNQRHYMIEEFVDGKDLRSELVQGQVWPRARASAVFSALCDGLGALRKKRIVHRDLKPTNVRLRPDGTPVIIDFGLARHLDLPDLTKTTDGAAIGTPAYFAPEQADPYSNKRNIDHRTDLFAIGVMAYEAIVGLHPYCRVGMTIAQLRDAICRSSECLKAPGFVSLPEQWKLILTKLLEKDRAKRVREAEQVSAILRNLGGL